MASQEYTMYVVQVFCLFFKCKVRFALADVFLKQSGRTEAAGGL